MKLPTLNLRIPKLQQGEALQLGLASSLRRFSPARLIRTARLNSARTIKRDASLHKPIETGSSTGKASTTKTFKSKTSKSSRLALNLLLVRPWVLLIGFWLVSMASATLALNGLLSPKKLTMSLPEPVAETAATTSSSLISVSQRSDKIAADSAEAASGADKTTAAPTDEVNDSGLPLLPLAAFVGACATGCLVMSRRRAMVRMAAARARGRVHKGRMHQPGKIGSERKLVKVSTPIKASDIKASGIKNAGIKASGTKEGTATAAPRRKKRRQRVRKATGVVKPAPKPMTAAGRVLVSRATAQKAVPQPPRVGKKQRRSTAARTASGRHPMVSVVPANESHKLDWIQGSLAHEMDMRHRKAM